MPTSAVTPAQCECQRPRDGDALLMPAGELVGQVPATLPQADGAHYYSLFVGVALQWLTDPGARTSCVLTAAPARDRRRAHSLTRVTGTRRGRSDGGHT